MKQFHLFMIILKLIISVDSDSNSYKLQTCLPATDRVNITRNIFEGNGDVVIETTNRSSHRIVSFIIAILIKERLGYNVSIRETEWKNTTETVNRLACSKKNCGKYKNQSHINMEVWMPPGFTSSEWVNKDLIVDCGPLGPSAKTGMFFYSQENNKNLTDDWRNIRRNIYQNIQFSGRKKLPFPHFPIYGNCNDTSLNLCRTIFSIDPILPKHQVGLLDNIYKHWTIEHAVTDSLNIFYFTWYPNEITVQYKLSRVLFPDCNKFEYVSSNMHCDDPVNQMAKVISIDIKTKAPLIYNLIDSFQLSQDDLLRFLRLVNISSVNRDQAYFEIGCDWVKNNLVSLKSWTLGWNTTKQLYIIVLLSKSESKMSWEEEAAVKHALQQLNNDTQFFGTLQYQLQIKKTFVTCDGQEMLQEYLESVSIESNDENNSIIGILSGLSTQCTNSIYKITNAQKKIMVSFRHEIYPILSRQANIQNLNVPYIYQTMPSKETYYALLLKISKHYGWNHFIIITDNDDYKSGLNASFIHKERIYRKGRNNEHQIEQFLRQSVKRFNAKIFLVDYTGDDVFQILCAAGKLQMSSANKFVWIINQRLENKQIIQELFDCSPYIQIISNDYFYLSPHKDLEISCRDFYSNNLYRGINFLGQTLALTIHKDPGVIDFNADLLMNFTFSDYFCIDKTIYHDSVKMNQNSLFWNFWFFYRVSSGKLTPLLKFELSQKCEIFDSLQTTMRSEEPWEAPKDGISIEDCWISFLANLLKIKCINAQILFLMIISMVILLIFTSSFCYVYYKKAKDINNPMKRAFHDLIQDLLDIDIHSSKLFLNHIIGRGAFGMVYGGEAYNSKGVLEAVAVKTISENSDWVEKTNFFTEAKVMRKLVHPNIVKLIGVCLENENNLIFLIMELMVEGDLRNYLLSRRSNAAIYPENSTEYLDLITRLNSFAMDTSEGLNYMHSKFMVHRDVACRNCLISYDFRIKLGDFGLTRYLSPSNSSGFYKSQGNLSLPIRWMPPEGIHFGQFSIKSDIWSFGILLFEIVTFGVCPYQDFSSSRNVELMDRIKRNQVSIVSYLPLSANNSTVYRLIEQCCSYYAKDRPESMEQVIAVLKSDSYCIRPHLTEDPPKFEGDNFNNLSVSHPGIIIGEEELSFRSPSEMQLNSSQKYLSRINRAFGIKSISVKEKTDFSTIELRSCQSSIYIPKNQLSTEGNEFIFKKKPRNLFVGSIPSDLSNDMAFHKKSRTSTRSINNILGISSKITNTKAKL